MNKIYKNSVLVFVLICSIMLFTFGGCSLEREYYDDIQIHLKTVNAEIVIKEWSFLLGSGAEVYYRAGGKDVFLGNLSGGDDGFCPFKEGKYSVTIDEDKLTIEWPKFPNSERDNWEKKTFDIPIMNSTPNN